jgi:hypothetical protein
MCSVYINMCNVLVINLFYTQSNKDLGFIKRGEFIDQLSDSYCLTVVRQFPHKTEAQHTEGGSAAITTHNR